MKIIVTGGAGFIGSAVIRHLIAETDWHIVNLDKLTYAANLDSLDSISRDPRYSFEQADICDAAAMARIFAAHRPDGIMHLAAESHVDRSIDGPAAFIDTNIVGTYVLLQAALGYWRSLEGEAAARFRFHHVSTDEVFGTLGAEGLFTEETPYQPNSPYSASKAASDHLVRAWYETYKLPVLLSNCSNNYGPFHFPEKLIPLVILNAVEQKPLPVYGKGENVRDWLFVEDHARALHAVFERGALGQSYNIGGRAERTNLQVVHRICELIDQLMPGRAPSAQLITYVTDRPGHDLRYAMDASKIERELGWKPRESFESGLEKTVRWYLGNRPWWEKIRGGIYAGGRLGLGKAG